MAVCAAKPISAIPIWKQFTAEYSNDGPRIRLDRRNGAGKPGLLPYSFLSRFGRPRNGHRSVFEFCPVPVLCEPLTYNQRNQLMQRRRNRNDPAESQESPLRSPTLSVNVRAVGVRCCKLLRAVTRLPPSRFSDTNIHFAKVASDSLSLSFLPLLSQLPAPFVADPHHCIRHCTDIFGRKGEEHMKTGSMVRWNEIADFGGIVKWQRATKAERCCAISRRSSV